MVGYGVDPGERDEMLLVRLNAELPAEIVEALAPWKDPRWTGRNIVHAGSAAEYGDAGGDLEEDGPAKPKTPYGRTKLEGTNAVSSAEKSGLRGVTARLFTVYGPGEHAGRLLPALICASRRGEVLKLTAGMHTRDFTYVEDVAEGLLRVGAASAIAGGVANLATGRLTSVRTFAKIAARILGIPEANLNFGAIPTRAEEMSHNPVSIERFRRIAGVVPQTGIEEGIRRTLTECAATEGWGAGF
jgi:nucleoside-diphosphate-sugar epimerase